MTGPLPKHLILISLATTSCANSHNDKISAAELITEKCFGERAFFPKKSKSSRERYFGILTLEYNTSKKINLDEMFISSPICSGINVRVMIRQSERNINILNKYVKSNFELCRGDVCGLENMTMSFGVAIKDKFVVSNNSDEFTFKNVDIIEGNNSPKTKISLQEWRIYKKIYIRNMQFINPKFPD